MLVSMSGKLRIGEVARQVGVTIDTIRFYNKLGLIDCPRQATTRYRIFTQAQVHELKSVRQLRDLGLSLREIKGLFALRRRQRPVCPEARKFLKGKLAQVKTKIEAFRQLETELKRALRKCERELRQKNKARVAPARCLTARVGR